MAKKYDPGLEQEVQHWIECVLKSPFPEELTFAEALKDGQRLCNLINTIKPGTIKKIETSSTMMFKQMENISKFLQACRELGVPSYDTFDVNDLYKENNMLGVLRCLDSLGRTVQKNIPDWTGPQLGVKMATKNERNFDPELLKKNVAVTKLNMGSATTMERKTFDHSASITFASQYSGKSSSDAPTFMTTGDVPQEAKDAMHSPQGKTTNP